MRRQVAIERALSVVRRITQVRRLLYWPGMKRVRKLTVERGAEARATWLHDESGNVVVGYLFVVAIAIAMAGAMLALASPIGKANELAQTCLAENNP